MQGGGPGANRAGGRPVTGAERVGSGGTWEGGFTLTGVSEGRGWTGVTDGVTEHGDGSKHKFPVTQHTVSPNPIYGF